MVEKKHEVKSKMRRQHFNGISDENCAHFNKAHQEIFSQPYKWPKGPLESKKGTVLSALATLQGVSRACIIQFFNRTCFFNWKIQFISDTIQ